MPIAIGGLAIIAAASFAMGLARVAPLPVGWIWIRYALILLVVPSLGEEILFRGLIVPPPGQPMPPLVAIASVAAFVL